MRSLQNRVFVCGADRSLTDSVQQFRYDLFVKNLGWSLKSIHGREVDEFDNETAVYSVLLDDNRVIACFRAIRTTNEYLATNIFPQLATVREYPRRHDIWEISRFGVRSSNHYFQIAKLTYGLMLKFAFERRAKALVAVTDVAHERNLGRHGIRTRRYGPPFEFNVQTDKPPTRLVAGEIPLDAQSRLPLARLIDLTDTVEIDDQTLVHGHTRVSTGSSRVAGSAR
jgi:acyl homoserine lactone synthase